MNGILKIDGNNASCVVEPGVSCFHLFEGVKRTGAVEVSWGNALHGGVGCTPYGDHFANHCGMEIVLPDGSVLRTCTVALPGENGEDNPTWQSLQPANGRNNDGMFSQSNHGVVTKMGFWPMSACVHQSYMVTFLREEDFEQVIQAIHPLALNRVLGNVSQIRHVIPE